MKKSKLYTFINGRIEYWDSWDDIQEYYEDIARSPETFDSFNIGYHDYSLEFSYDGCFLYPADRDDRDRINNGDIHFSSLFGIEDLMKSHGDNYIDFLFELDGSLPVSNSLNHDDFYVFELREKMLIDKLSNTKTLTLYPEDFENDSNWSHVCDQLDIECELVSEVNIKTLSVELPLNNQGEELK